MNLRKLYQSVNYILSKYKYRLDYTKLIKLLYLADRACLERNDFSITEDDYYSMPRGMVLSNLYNFISKQNNVEFNSLFIKNGYELISMPEDKYPHDELCKAEIDILDEIDKKYHNRDWKYLVNEVHHKLPEWDKSVAETHTSRKVERENLLKILGKSKEEIQSIMETEKQFNSLEEKLDLIEQKLENERSL